MCWKCLLRFQWYSKSKRERNFSIRWLYLVKERNISSSYPMKLLTLVPFRWTEEKHRHDALFFPFVENPWNGTNWSTTFESARTTFERTFLAKSIMQISMYFYRNKLYPNALFLSPKNNGFTITSFDDFRCHRHHAMFIHHPKGFLCKSSIFD